MNTLLFLLSLIGTFYFVAKLLVWHAYSTQEREREVTNRDILIANVVGYISIIGWTVLFYLLTN